MTNMFRPNLTHHKLDIWQTDQLTKWVDRVTPMQISSCHLHSRSCHITECEYLNKVSICLSYAILVKKRRQTAVFINTVDRVHFPMLHDFLIFSLVIDITSSQWNNLEILFTISISLMLGHTIEMKECHQQWTESKFMYLDKQLRHITRITIFHPKQCICVAK